MSLKQRIQDDVKAAMRSKDKPRLGVIRLLTAAIKQREVDERIELDDAAVISVIEKMAKQRRDSIEQYRRAGRTELADQEEFEIEVLSEYLPQALPDAEIDHLVDTAIAATGATGMQDMGRVMAALRPQVQGRADMGEVSRRVKGRLGA